ncbi:MFS transporter, SP family, sugar:H+ symporter [Galdieria sulphuraria]|uniref:MFS transporter, SP family, sugar:H+ symporter n=1 Tax=Galdieria sulphuraria TaxID=130081 RepID=M2WXF5_GALSU|nr:MFS transporter, SP family, sugar:H+ symporter [Galdieria sulphuraria]EME28725.1 MFS transporter, SP family, sugar:H+ symporter [Galdieria sulphuraria]|eukprot:XP_005705245.1 MFS transporter, SP family, sugar:H+ symporter [Galdieria sulphuraria]
MASSRTEERSIQTSIVEKARYAVGGDSEEEIEAELHKLEHCCVSHRQYFIFALPIFGKAKYFVWILASLASIGGILYGIDQSLISSAGLYIPEDLHYDSNIESIISGFMPLGGIFGAFLVYPANELFGRKWSIASACLLDICGGILEADAHSWQMLLAGRMIVGVGVAIEAATVPGYIAECSPKHRRGSLVSLYQLCVMLGLLFGYIDAAIFVNLAGNWRWMLGSSLLFSGIFLISICVLPESPRYLMKEGRRVEAYFVWKRIRGFQTFEEKKEFFWMEQQVLKEMQESKDRWNVLDFVRKPRCRRAAQYAIILMILQQFSGINTINHYMGILMLEIGMNKQNAVYMSVIGGATGLLSTIPAIYLVDRLGRRTLLLSFIGGVFCGLLIIGFSFWTTNIRTKVGLYIWGVVVYYLFWGSCLGPIPWVVGSEVWPTYLRSQGLCIADISKWIGEFVTTFAFPYMVNAMKKTGIFCGFYAGIILMGTLYLMFFMPETKCKTLEELEEVFHQPMRVLLKQNKNNLKETWQALKGFHVNKIWLCSP